MIKKIFKFLLVFTLMLTCIPTNIKVKANDDDVIYTDLKDELAETLDEFYFQNKSIYFYDENGLLINDDIQQLKSDYINDKESVVDSLIEIIASTTKVEDVNSVIQNREAVMPDLGGGGSTYQTKVLTTTEYFSPYANATFTFTGRVRIGEYVEHIDINIANPTITKKVADKYKDSNVNFLVAFDQYIACYGNCMYGCSMYAYTIQYKVTLYIGKTNTTVKNNQLEKEHAYIYARNYTWFDDYEDFYDGL